MNSPSCEECTHFHQHYVLDKQRCSPIDCGHCSYPRLKHRNAHTKACIHYIQREEPVELPVRAEVINFLTTEILEHILSLELPPEIDAPQL